MRKSTRVVSSGEAASYDSDSKQTIPGSVGHLAEIEEAVALAASPFSLLQPQRSIRPENVFAAKLRDSPQRAANAYRPKHLASARVCNAVKTRAKTPS